MNRDNHDKQMLKALQRIARSLDSLVQIESLVHKDLIEKHIIDDSEQEEEEDE